MTNFEQKAAAKKFAEYWQAREGYERGETQLFWIGLLERVYGVENPEEYIRFEERTQMEHTGFIDAYIPSTRVIIEQKSREVSLQKERKSAYQQARDYIAGLPVSQHPRWIVTCNFDEFLIYDMENPPAEPESLLLKNLGDEYSRLNFLIDETDHRIQRETQISIDAGKIVQQLYDALLNQYKDPTNPDSLKALNKLCVRIVFCLYAEDARIFDSNSTTTFHDYLERHRTEDRNALIHLFRVLDQDPDKGQRDPYLSDDLAAFPYVNGGLFADEDIEIPRLGDEVLDLILDVACAFNWSRISPTIFGAVFESTLNPDTRRKGGMHYTSVENIHKVIDPLFLDGLREELEAAKKRSIGGGARTKAMQAFQDKIASLKFLDPACGSGNFLTETYLSLRRMENEVIQYFLQDQQQFSGGYRDWIQVSIDQFYGIEINDFAVAVARTALWIAEIQMKQETEDILRIPLDFLPLKSNPNIIEGNALRMRWEEVVAKDELNYIIGNPPFRGFKPASAEQKADMQVVFAGTIKPNLMDYVCCWYKVAAEYIDGTHCEVAFVSTNSVTQGQMAGDLWTLLLNKYHLKINFAWTSFVWGSESKDVAHVHCVIIGFSCFNRTPKILYSSDNKVIADNICPYLKDLPNIVVSSRGEPLCDVPEILMGNQAMDNGNLIIEEKEYGDFISKEPGAIPFIKRYMMGEEFIKNKKRWCLWLKDCTPEQLKSMPLVYKRVKAVQEFRAASSDPGARRKADTPWLFREQRNPKQFIAIPIVSSERRGYIPIGYLDESVIAGNKLFIISNSSLYHFGVLTSNVHMAWMRTIAARLKSDYTYSKDVVYNNFPWPVPTENQRTKIEETAEAILNARALFPDSSLNALYDKTSMPQVLRRAHKQNDKAVWEAYGKAWPLGDEGACVRWLMERYQELTSK